MGEPGAAEANARAAAAAVRSALLAGVRTFCVCPGGRNAPWVELLDRLAAAETIEFLGFFDERSAAFFALGRAKRDGRPAAVCTTSGTAVAELLPAFVEARHADVPLWALTADRPHRFRGTGAPQTIEQAGLLGGEVDCVLDVDAGDRGLDVAAPPPPARRVHWNLAFEEPLLSRDSQLWDALVQSLCSVGIRDPAPPSAAGDAAVRPVGELARLSAGGVPLLLLGGLRDAGDRAAVAQWVDRIGAPVLAEASSHLRAHRLVSPWLLRGGEDLARAALLDGRFSGVVRFGAVPSFRLWRDLEYLNPRPPVFAVSRAGFPGLSGAVTHHVVASIPPPGPAVSRCRDDDFVAELLRRDRERLELRRALRRELPRSEPSLVAAVADAVPARALVYLGNSLPVREWTSDAACEREADLEFDENRGANGIDGQLSSFFGALRPETENVGLFGDLTALYDLSAPWILPALGAAATRASVVVVHNGGGRIFDGMFANPRFLNAHAVSLEPWARLWGLVYAGAETAAEVQAAMRSWERGGTPAARLLEVRPDALQTAEFRRRWAAATTSR